MHLLLALAGSVAVTLGVGSPPSPLRAALLADGYVAVPMTPIAGGAMYMVTCQYGKHTLKLGLDTGAGNFALIATGAAKRLGLPVIMSGKSIDVDGELTVDMSYLTQLSVGGFPAGGGSIQIKDLQALCGAAGLEKLGVELDGLLGHACLNNNDAVIDYPSSTLFLRTPSQSDLPRLAGDWTCVRFEKEGVVAPPADIARESLRVEGDAAHFGPPPNPVVKRLLLNDRRSPKKVTLWREYNHGSRLCTPAIYRLDGDELTICMPLDASKPTVVREFKTAPGSNTQLVVFRRVAK